MRIHSKWILLLASVCCTPASAFTVFACEPEWAELTRVLMPNATIHTATHLRQDPHHIEARPALIAQLRSADLAVCTGASLENGWLPMLQERAGNAKVQNGTQGMFYAANYVTLIDPRPGAGGNPFAGDIHAEGNPHIHTDPRNIVQIATALAERLQKLSPSDAGEIEQRRIQFDSSWKQHIKNWEQKAGSLRGKTVAAQHATFGYLWKWLDMKQVADLEPKPGMAPSPGHLQGLLQTFKQQPPAAIVISSYQDPRAGRWLADKLDNRTSLITLPATLEDERAPDALAQWFDKLLNELKQLKAR